MDVKAALERGKTLPWALVRTQSGAAQGPAPEAVDLAELMEARFFGPQEEIRLFPGESGFQAVRVAGEEGDEELEERRALANSRFGAAVTVRSTLGFDEDGQAYIISARLAGWEGGD